MKRLVVLSGAGVSKESGINTFRDSGGLWEQYPVEDVASIDGWRRNRSLVLEFYNARRRDLKDRQPNEAHRIIAGLERDFKVTVITQNVDNLHERAGSSDIIHLHGELTKARGEFSPEPIYDIGYRDIHLGDKDSRGEQLRPHIVWFGEAVPMIEPAAETVSGCDILLVIGTSLNVYPAAGLINYIRGGVPVFLIDPHPMSLNYKHYTQIQDVATSGMRKFRDICASLL
ncbi:MAG TPA: NAD-dependent deacylase [Candidatus Coprenecus stercoravium]|uniref:protein acetyllysine N-acetyltransferase n=1 Tax=Candidatus Coprenecus stercoravium TaxID=2840735 RepID=A0A9D2K8S0_9BACT|nr:NAD-dependent deacylase [Candidatus Coprenecus stercoravium]